MIFMVFNLLKIMKIKNLYKSWGKMKMNINISKKFIEFEKGWHKKIDFDQEADELLNALNSAKKENDIQRYIKNNKK